MDKTNENGSVAGFFAGKTFCFLTKSSNDSVWIVDSGASDHVTYDLSLLHNVKKMSFTCNITMPNGKRAPITHSGSMFLRDKIEIHNVLYIPSFQYNLLSVSKLARQLSANVIFTPTSCVLQAPTTQKELLLGKEHKGLYLLHKDITDHQANLKTPSLNTESFSAVSLSSSELWHKRLGHLPFGKFKDVNLSSCIDKTHGVCQVCPMAKLHRQPFPLSTHTTDNSFVILHVDIWGPCPYKTYDGAVYFLSIVDDKSRATWVHLMATKSAAFPLLKTFITYVEKQYEATVKIIRTDNGLEFKDSSALEFYKTQGITHQTTCVDTPQQNGIVERKHQHLLQIVRALLFQSNIPNKFWGDALLTAVYLINRMPSSVLNNQSPFEVLYNTKPTYDNLRTFGGLCYAATLKRNRDKLQSRANPCIFIGYPFNQKAYKLFDLKAKKIIVSRDVVFHECIFPYHSLQQSSDLPLPAISDYIPDTLDTLSFPLNGHNSFDSDSATQTNIPSLSNPHIISHNSPSENHFFLT